jgi:metal-dependent amidase/aminoacylase/carboxypeptidase family protein
MPDRPMNAPELHAEEGRHLADLVALRRDLHAHPELGFEERRTSELVATRLTGWGIPVHRGLAQTGVVGIVHGRDGGACGRALGLRADMDALPVRRPTPSATPAATPA